MTWSDDLPADPPDADAVPAGMRRVRHGLRGAAYLGAAAALAGPFPLAALPLATAGLTHIGLGIARSLANDGPDQSIAGG